MNLPTGTAHPTLTAKSHLLRLPAMQADVCRKAILGIATSKHLFHFRYLVRSDLPLIGSLILAPVVAVSDNRFERYSSGHPLYQRSRMPLLLDYDKLTGDFILSYTIKKSDLTRPRLRHKEATCRAVEKQGDERRVKQS